MQVQQIACKCTNVSYKFLSTGRSYTLLMAGYIPIGPIASVCRQRRSV